MGSSKFSVDNMVEKPTLNQECLCGTVLVGSRQLVQGLHFPFNVYKRMGSARPYPNRFTPTHDIFDSRPSHPTLSSSLAFLPGYHMQLLLCPVCLEPTKRYRTNAMTDVHFSLSAVGIRTKRNERFNDMSHGLHSWLLPTTKLFIGFHLLYDI